MNPWLWLQIVQEAFMKWLPNFLVILATLGLLVGLAIRIVKGGFLGDQLFYWRGSVSLLALSIAISLIQNRNK
jgi:archaellum biogenesis protein FlaJ (TadC family)